MPFAKVPLDLRPPSSIQVLTFESGRRIVKVSKVINRVVYIQVNERMAIKFLLFDRGFENKYSVNHSAWRAESFVYNYVKTFFRLLLSC